MPKFAFLKAAVTAQTATRSSGFYAYDCTSYRITVQSDPIGIEGGPNTYLYAMAAPTKYTDPTGEFGIVGAFIGGGIDLAIQLAMNGGNLRCVNWEDVALAGLAGALTGGLGQGAFRLKTGGSHTWDATRSWINRGGLFPGRTRGTHLHHGVIEQGSVLGRAHPNIANQPWNLRPASPELHQAIHHEFGALGRWWYGHPEWLIGSEISLGGYGAAAVAGDRCGC